MRPWPVGRVFRADEVYELVESKTILSPIICNLDLVLDIRKTKKIFIIFFEFAQDTVDQLLLASLFPVYATYTF